MAVRGWSPGKIIASPRGAWTALLQRQTGTPQRASFMQNWRVNPRAAGSREGTTAIGPAIAIGPCTGIFNWITPSEVNYVLFQDGTTIKAYNQNVPGTQTLLSGLTNYAPSFSDYDIWTYIAGYNASNDGAFQVRIFDGTNVDKAFGPAPVLSAATAVDGGSGQATAGTHYIGFVYQDRTGFSTVPVTTLSGTAISVTLNAGLRKINISVTLPALANGGGNATLFLIATRADNPSNWYFIPTDAQNGSIGEQPVPFNSITTLNFVMSFSDEDIAASLDSANNQFLRLTQDGGGNGPFNPNFLNAYGQRMVYGVGPTLYISNISDPQALTGDQNTISMPNKRDIGFAFQLPGSTSLYVSGDGWTSYVTDNSDVPATWSEPISVSSSLGAKSPNLVCARTGGNHAFIATETGVYRFSGQFDELPMTYLVSGYDNTQNPPTPIGWNRVNWNASIAIQMADDVVNHRLYVGVPMDGATVCNYMFCIDYTNGLPYNQCDVSLDVFTPATFAALGIVKNPSTGIRYCWIGPATAGRMAFLDSNSPNDQGAAINAYWESGLIRNLEEIQSSLIRTGPFDVWCRGNGPVTVTLYGPDRTINFNTPLMLTSGILANTITAAPGQMYAIKTDLAHVENFTIRFTTNTVNAWIQLSAFRAYMKKDLFNR